MRRITLEPMAPRDIHKLAELTLRGVLPKTVRELLSQAHGLPSNVGVVLGTLAQTGALVQVEKEWLVFPAAVSDTELPLWSDHITDALSELSPRAQDILREVGERSQPTKRAEFKSAGDMTAIEELLSVGLLRQDLDGRRVEAAGSSVVERLFSKEDFDIEIAELLPAATP